MTPLRAHHNVPKRSAAKSAPPTKCVGAPPINSWCEENSPQRRGRHQSSSMQPWAHRLYFWGVHGIFAEVMFTAIWEFLVSGKWNLMGVSSIWSFWIYGLGSFLMAETGYNFMKSRKIPLLLRCCAYVIFTYIWEFSWGVVLEYFDARSWDYTPFDYDIMGLITLEYIPVWFMAGLYFEFIMSVMESVEPIPRWKGKTE